MDTAKNGTNDSSQPQKSMFTQIDEKVARKMKEHHEKKKAEEQQEDSKE